MAPEFQLFLLITLCCCFVDCRSSKKSCYSHEDHHYKLFASKTAYDEVRSFHSLAIPFSPECIPRQFYLIARHGTRFPKSTDIQRMRSKLPEIRDDILRAAERGRGKLCRPDLNLLKLWRIHVEISSDEKLAPTGEREFQEIGRRFKTRIPTILESPNISSIDVRVTDVERTRSSAQHFLFGLLEDEGSLVPLIEDNDLLQFYKMCNRWQKKVEKNVVSGVEGLKFQRSSRMDKLARRVSRRMGLKKTLKQDDIGLIYDMCRFESAWDPDAPSAWCTVFRPNDLRTLEYSEDLNYFYKHGYGHSINFKQACPPVEDLVNHFQAKMENRTSEPDILLRFSHSGMMLKLYGRLGLFKDLQPLKSNNFKRQKDRKWRTSVIDAFASNLVFVLLDCESRFKVAAFFQEQEILLPYCTTTPCSIDEFLAVYKSIAKRCDVTEICRVL